MVEVGTRLPGQIRGFSLERVPGRANGNPGFATFTVPPGGMQQQVLNAEPGHYVQVCFMDAGRP